MTNWDMHQDPAARAPGDHRLQPGATVRATVICHHPWGIGVELADGTRYGHIDAPRIGDETIRGPQDYPAIGDTTTAVVLGYSGSGQLRLSIRPSDITNAEPAGNNQEP